MTRITQIKEIKFDVLSALSVSSAVKLLTQLGSCDPYILSYVANVLVGIFLVPRKDENVVQRFCRQRVIAHFVINGTFASKVERELAVAERVLFLKYLTHKRRFHDVTWCGEYVLFLKQICEIGRASCRERV